MGLIKAGLGALGSTLGDQWKEFFYCEALSPEVLVAKGQKRVSNRSSNTRGSDNIITDGSGIAVANGQAMIIVENGEVVEFSAEPGEYTFDASSEPSIFTGDLRENIEKTFEIVKKRFTYGGDPGKDQRIYYFNTKEIPGNKFGTTNPVPFRIVDNNIGLDVDISVRANGLYSYIIEDPLLFYTNVTGNVQGEYRREEIDQTLKSEFLNALQPAFAKISAMGIRYSELPGHTMELSKAMNEVLTEKWRELRGLRIISVSLNSITAPEEDEEMIKRVQRDAVYRNPSMAGATMVGAQSDAMRDAAKNEAGAFTGYMGMGMAQNSGGANASDFFKMAEEEERKLQQQNLEKREKAPTGAQWFCSECGAENVGKFCTNCGAKKPNTTKVKCDNCGWESESEVTPNFCPDCGNKF